jgi:hypothetical protein
MFLATSARVHHNARRQGYRLDELLEIIEGVGCVQRTASRRSA